jgi:fructosamine-3-kinase
MALVQCGQQTYFEKVGERLLLPLQSDGRVLKPSLFHGDCWDGNIAMDMKTGDAFVFDLRSFYGHNEYGICSGRAPDIDSAT